jgi:hypothetical protein
MVGGRQFEFQTDGTSAMSLTALDPRTAPVTVDLHLGRILPRLGETGMTAEIVELLQRGA